MIHTEKTINHKHPHLLMGHYYKDSKSLQVYRAELCTYCSMRKVANWNFCMFHNFGMIKLSAPTGWTREVACGCLPERFVEITKEEYDQIKVSQMIKEGL